MIVDIPSETSENASDPCQPAAENNAKCAYFIWLSEGRPEAKRFVNETSGATRRAVVEISLFSLQEISFRLLNKV